MGATASVRKRPRGNGGFRIPLLGKGGVNAPRSRKAAKHPLKGAEGVVRSTSDYRNLERTAPSAPTKEAELFIDARPPRLRPGGTADFAPTLPIFMRRYLPAGFKELPGD